MSLSSHVIRLGVQASACVFRGISAALLITLLGCLPSVADETVAADDSFDWGFLASRHETVYGGKRLTALGPLFERVTLPDGTSYWGLRPFYSQVRVPSKQKTHKYYLWPLGLTSRYMNEFKWRFLLAYGRKGHPGDPDTPYMRFNIFPLYFQTRGDDGKLSVAVIPLGGTLRDFIFYDRISFFLFPLWMKWQSKDVESQNFLWPLIASTKSTKSDRIRRVRVLPFYAKSVDKDRYYKKAIMWPIWTWSRFLEKRSEGYAYMVWPLWGRINRKSETGWLFLPPFFRFTSGKEGRRIFAPWPFVQIHESKYVKKYYVWPFYGKRQVGPQTRYYFLWPFIWYRTLEMKEYKHTGHTIVPFLIADKLQLKNADGTPGKVTRRLTKLWPLFSYRLEGDTRHTRVLDLWPFRETQGVEQSWAPLWTLFSHTVVRDKGYDSELLWGLYRQQVRRDTRRYNALFPIYSYERDNAVNEGKKEWTFLKGLIGYKREFGIRRYRLLYFIEFGGKRKEP